MCYKIGNPGPCVSFSLVFYFRGCNNGAPSPSAINGSVTITQGAATHTASTSSGSVTFTGLTAGSWVLSATPTDSRYATFTATYSLPMTMGGFTGVASPISSRVCFGTCSPFAKTAYVSTSGCPGNTDTAALPATLSYLATSPYSGQPCDPYSGGRCFISDPTSPLSESIPDGMGGFVTVHYVWDLGFDINGYVLGKTYIDLPNVSCHGGALGPGFSYQSVYGWTLSGGTVCYPLSLTAGFDNLGNADCCTLYE